MASTANAVPVTAAILQSPGGLLPGMAVEASIILSTERGPRGYLVPLVAIAPGDKDGHGYIFKYDAAIGAANPCRGRSASPAGTHAPGRSKRPRNRPM